jgi:excisionase family DNA binding protein
MDEDISMLNKVAYTVNEALHVINIGRTKFYDEVKAGRIITVKCGTKTLVPAAEPEEWLKRLATMPQSK